MSVTLGLNVAAIIGRLSRPAAARELPSGDRLLAFEVSIEGGERVETVPVVWLGAPASAEALETGETVLVVGRVRRRFFRSGATRQSRTEVVAKVVMRTGRSKRAGAALARAASQLEQAASELSLEKTLC